jgi:RNA polymerase sigma factor (TIGR02999 family)
MIGMGDVTQILSKIEYGDPSAAEQLLPLIYDELRGLAAVRMAHESPDHTLQPTALVHEAYLRLVDVEKAQHWESKGHFFSAASEAMRRILVDAARRKSSIKRGGEFKRPRTVSLDEIETEFSDDLLAVDEALTDLARHNRQAAELVKLRVFGGLSAEEAASLLGLSPRSAARRWAYARAWLIRETLKT